MHNLEKEAKEFMKKRKQTFNIMDDVIKSLERQNSTKSWKITSGDLLLISS